MKLTILLPVAALVLAAPSLSQSLLTDTFSDANYRLQVTRPAEAILVPPAQVDIEGRAGLVSLLAGAYQGRVRGIYAPDGASHELGRFVQRALNGYGRSEDFEFRSLASGSDSLGEAMSYLGTEALRIRLLDDTRNDGDVIECRIVQRGDTALLFSVNGPLSAIGEDGKGFDPFFDAFTLGEGAFAHRASPPHSLDFEGPGYRVRGGVLESGELEIRMAPPAGWRTESRVLAMDLAFRSHALFASPDGSGRVTIELANGPEDGLEPDAPGNRRATKAPVPFAGMDLALTEFYPSGRKGMLRVEEGYLRHKGHAPADAEGPLKNTRVQVIIERDSIEKREPELQAAFVGAERLSAAEADAILAETTGLNDPQVGLAQYAWLRGGTYYNQTYGLRWSPPSGVWVHTIEPHHNYSMSRSLLLRSYNHADGLIFTLSAKKTVTKDLERAHRRSMRTLLKASRKDTASVACEATTWFGHPALVTEASETLGVGALCFITALIDGHALQICATSTLSKPAAGTKDQLSALCKAAVADAELLRPRFRDESAYVDPRFRFSVDLAGGPWTPVDRDIDESEIPYRSSFQVKREDGLNMSVFARWADPIGYLNDTVHERHSAFYETASALISDGTTFKREPMTMHMETPVEPLRLKAGGLEWYSTVLRRGPIVYTLSIWNEEEQVAPIALDFLLDRLRFH